MPGEAFDAWLAQSRRGLAAAQDGGAAPGEPVLAGSSLVEEGQRVAAAQACLKCHTVDGARHIGPTWVDLYGRTQKMKDGRMLVADEAYLTRSMMDPAAEIVAGYQNVMPTYQGKLSPPEVAAVLEYIKSLKTPAVRVGPTEGPVYESVDKQRP
jgi:cytochrome c oxidase subunit 2